ncbi:MAG: hypothetical protein OXH80_04545 [Nitrospira sp.]|nr:hypothetical protein [Nitrospira sp.]
MRGSRVVFFIKTKGNDPVPLTPALSLQGRGRKNIEDDRRRNQDSNVFTFCSLSLWERVGVRERNNKRHEMARLRKRKRQEKP